MSATYVYLAARRPPNTVRARYVRLIRVRRFELALTWIVPSGKERGE